MSNKIDYLRSYDEEIEILEYCEITKIDKNVVPEIWIRIFKEKNKVDRKKLLLNHWKEYVQSELKNTIAYLEYYLEEIDLIKSGEEYSIIYTIKNENGEVLYYEGKNPKGSIDIENLIEGHGKLKDFYSNIHNGFYYYASESMGLLSIESIMFLGDDEFDWDMSEETLSKISLNESYAFFSNGMGTYLVIDNMNSEIGKGVLWSTKIPIRFNIDFWNYTDEWIVMGFRT